MSQENRIDRYRCTTPQSMSTARVSTRLLVQVTSLQKIQPSTKGNSHHYQCCRCHNRDHSWSQYRLTNNGKGLVYDHIGQEQGNKQKMPIFSQRLYPCRLLSLCSIQAVESWDWKRRGVSKTYGEPLIASTFSWVSSKLIYPDRSRRIQSHITIDEDTVPRT